MNQHKKSRLTACKPASRRAANEARTRDPQLGKLMLYQLSYYRICFYGDKCSCFFSTLQIIAVLLPLNWKMRNGKDRFAVRHPCLVGRPLREIFCRVRRDLACRRHWLSRAGRPIRSLKTLSGRIW